MQNMSFKKYLLALLFLVFATGIAQAQKPVKDPDPHRYQNEIDAFKQWDAKNSYPAHAVLFVGSSSIRFWKSHDGFPSLPIINRGFGGSHISDVQYYYDQVIYKYRPAMIVFYCGDNDIAANKPVEQVVGDYKELTDRILHDFPDIVFIYLPIKPSSSRWQYWPKMAETNRRIKEYNSHNSHLLYIDTATPLLGKDGRPDDSLFRTDHLHLNAKGYAIWNHLLSAKLISLYNKISHK